MNLFMWVMLVVLIISVVNLGGGATKITNQVFSGWPRMNILAYLNFLAGFDPGRIIGNVIKTLLREFASRDMAKTRAPRFLRPIPAR